MLASRYWRIRFSAREDLPRRHSGSSVCRSTGEERHAGEQQCLHRHGLVFEPPRNRSCPERLTCSGRHRAGLARRRDLGSFASSVLCASLKRTPQSLAESFMVCSAVWQQQLCPDLQATKGPDSVHIVLRVDHRRGVAVNEDTA